MPLIGLTDRRGKDIKWEDIKRGKGDFEDPPPVLLALYPDRVPYVDFSVTEMLNDPYQEQMKRRYGYYESPDDIADRTMGIAIHYLFEAKAEELPGLVSEQQFTMKMMGVMIGGRTDLMICDGAMWDYKTASMAKLRMLQKGKGYDSYKWQLNMYRWFHWKNTGEEIEALKIRFVPRDWRFYEFRQKKFIKTEYPKSAILPIPIVPLKEVETFIKERLKLHIEAARVDDDALEDVGECDTWYNGKYKERTRCVHYCPFDDICYFRRRERRRRRTKTKSRRK